MDLKFKIIILLVAFSLFLGACSSSVRFSQDTNNESRRSNNQQSSSNMVGAVLLGKASYYHDKFHGRQTASGEIFDQNKLTAAHKTLNFGTVLKVKNLKNGKQVVVVVNDRGPFVEGRIIDLDRKSVV